MPCTLVIENRSAEVNSSPAGGAFATDGDKWVRLQALGIIRFDLNVPATSFGLSITDWGDGAFAGTLTIFMACNLFGIKIFMVGFTEKCRKVRHSFPARWLALPEADQYQPEIEENQ